MLWGALHVIRLFVIFCFDGLLSRLGYRLDRRQMVVLGFSGLRGAVGLALALIVNLDHEFNNTIRDLVLFHVSGIAIITLLLNGTTASMVIKQLGLMRISNVKKKMMKTFLKAYEMRTEEAIHELDIKRRFHKVDWEKVRKIANARSIYKLVYQKQHIKGSYKSQNLGVNNADILVDTEKYSSEELIIETRHRMLTTLKGIYWEFFEEGLCNPNAVVLLIESADRAIDHETEQCKDWMFFQEYFGAKTVNRIYNWGSKIPIIGEYFVSKLYHKLYLQYDICINFIEAHERTENILKHILSGKELKVIIFEMSENKKEAMNYLKTNIEQQFGHIIGQIQ